jgi:hypothetical protein
MLNLTPKTAMQAARIIRVTEAARKLDAVCFWNGDGTCTLDSWKTNADGKRIKSRYEVDLNAKTCTCPNFAEYGDFCKHLIYADNIAAAQEDAETAQESLLAQMDADAANCEGAYPY